MPETQLAASVITQALKDYHKAGLECQKGPRYSRNAALGQMSECETFLMGKTDIAKFWFQCAGFRPLNKAQIKEYATGQYKLIERTRNAV